MLLAVLLPASAPTTDWHTYINSRYAFEICYPADLLIPQGEADNGDGQVFTAGDGAELRVYGANNALDRTLSEEVAEAANRLRGPRGAIVYRATRPNWEVVSGHDGGSLAFYRKTILRDDQFLTFELRYPLNPIGKYKPVVERLTRCFKPL